MSTHPSTSSTSTSGAPIGRRHFLAAAGAAALAPSVWTAPLRSAGAQTAGPAPSVPSDLVAALIASNDDLVPGQLARQERRADVRGFGGVPDGYGIPGPGGTAGFISILSCAHATPTSRYFHSAELTEPLQRAARAMLAHQHEDGTIDLPSTNFHSTPDTAFILELICPAYGVFSADPWTGHAPVLAALKTFILKAGEALVTGGIHTPNHRWVVCGALARVNALFPDARYVARVDQWLDETIDIDPDGQFTEKSTSVYSPVVNHALLTVARLLNRPALRDPVRKNLEMTLYYIHPDGEVVTEASRRQDKYQRGSMSRYYASYRELALLDGNGRFATIARQIETTARAHLVRELPAFLENPSLQLPLPPEIPLPTRYSEVFAYSSLARIRRDDVSATVLATNPTLFSLRKGLAALEAVRVATSFFGKGQFMGDRLEVLDGRFRLHQRLEGPYFQPLPREKLAELAGPVTMEASGILRQDHKAARAQSNIQVLDATVDVVESDGRFELRFNFTGTDHVPVAIELAFRHGGVLAGVEPVKEIRDAFLLRTGTGRYTFEKDTIEFGPGLAEHGWTQLRGALPKWDGQSVYLTGFTPFRLTLKLS